MCLSLCASSASNYGRNVPVDMTPGPVPMYRSFFQKKKKQDSRRDTARIISRIRTWNKNVNIRLNASMI